MGIDPALVVVAISPCLREAAILEARQGIFVLKSILGLIEGAKKGLRREGC